MTTKNPRVNITFDKEILSSLTSLADKQNKSLASLVRELTLEALEMREDFYLSKLVNNLDLEDAEIYSHAEAWK